MSTDAEDTLTNLTQHSRKLINAIRNIGLLGLDSTLPSLPKFAIVGDQSSGKSSIVQAICGINLPRDMGTCTRCPFEITTASCTVWKCTVSLEYSYEYKRGKKAGDIYRDWTKLNDPECVVFRVVYNKDELEEVLRRAQVAILNPTRKTAEFFTGDLPSTKSQVGFSLNVVGLSISGPGLPELSFFDLPGAINVCEDKNDAHLIGLIEVLAKGYIKDESCRILLALACNQDTMNSTAFRYVRESGVEDRCMGVLTKPDLLGTEHTDHVGRMLNNEKFKLGYGRFVSRQPSQAEVMEGVSRTDAAMREIDFFASNAPWTTTLARFSDRFGVSKLQSAISERLTDHIQESLPVIEKRVENSLAITERSLQALPEAAKFPVIEVMTTVRDLVKYVCVQLEGDVPNDTFRKLYRATTRRLLDNLLKTRPVVKMDTPGFRAKITIALDSGSEDAELEESPSKHRKTANGTPLKIKKETEKQTSPLAIAATRFTLTELRELGESGSSNSLPGQISRKTTDRIIQQSRCCWETLVKETLQEFRCLFEKMLTDMVQRCLGTRSQTALFTETSNLMLTLFRQLMDRQQDAIIVIVQDELYKPYTIAADALKDRKAIVSSQLLNERKQIRIKEHFDLLESTTNKTTTWKERKAKATETWIETNIKKDPYEDDLKLMVVPLAYYDNSALHLVDSITKSMDHRLVHELSETLERYVLIGLRCESVERSAQLLEDDPERQRTRSRLVIERQKLVQALQELKGLSITN